MSFTSLQLYKDLNASFPALTRASSHATRNTTTKYQIYLQPATILKEVDQCYFITSCLTFIHNKILIVVKLKIVVFYRSSPELFKTNQRFEPSSPHKRQLKQAGNEAEILSPFRKIALRHHKTAISHWVRIIINNVSCFFLEITIKSLKN